MMVCANDLDHLEWLVFDSEIGEPAAFISQNYRVRRVTPSVSVPGRGDVQCFAGNLLNSVETWPPNVETTGFQERPAVLKVPWISVLASAYISYHM